MAIGVARPNTEIGTANEPEYLSAAFLAESLSELAEAQRRIARRIESETRLVDEYITQGPNPVSITSLTVPPQFEEFYEKIKRVIVTGPTSGGQTGAQVFGSVTNPGAGATIVNLGVLPPGTYQIYWSVGLEGTVTSADADNMRLQFQGGTVLVKASYQGAAGEYPQQTVQIVSDGTNATRVTVTAIAAASGASAIYTAQVTASPVAGQMAPFLLQLGDRYWNLQLPPTGILEFSADILLSRTDQRKLSSSVAGAWFLELTGEADVRNRE